MAMGRTIVLGVAAIAVLARAQGLSSEARDVLLAAKLELRDGGVASQAMVKSLGVLQQQAPEHPAVASSYAMALISRGDVAKAIPIMRKVVRIAPSAPGIAGMMLRLAEEEPPEEARALLERALAVQPAGPLAVDASHRLGKLLESSGRDDGSTSASEAAEAARRAYRASVALAAAAGRAPKPETLVLLSLDLSRGDTPDAKQRDEAIDLARRATALEPKDAMPYLALGRALAAVRNATDLGADERIEAVGALRTASQLKTPLSGGAEARAAVLHLLGSVLASTPRITDKQLDEAEQVVYQATELAPSNLQYERTHRALQSGIEKRRARRAFENRVLEGYEEMLQQSATDEAGRARAEQKLMQHAAQLPLADKISPATWSDDGGHAASETLATEGVVHLASVLGAAKVNELREHVSTELDAAVAAEEAGDLTGGDALFSPIAARIFRRDFKLRLSPILREALSIA